METHDHISVIEALSCLGDLPLDQLSVLIRLLESTRVPAGQALFKQGDIAEQVYFIGSGRLAKHQDGNFCGRLSQGQIAGWDSFFHRCPRDHSLIAENDCFVYVLQRTDMDKLSAEHPEVLNGFLLAATPVPVTGKPVIPLQANKRVGVFTFADLKAESSEVFERLLACYNGKSDIACYSCVKFCQLAGVEAHSDELFGHLAADMFAHLESERATVFYTATVDDPHQWLQKIISQVDTLILVVKDSTDTLPLWFTGALRAADKKPGLVILRPGAGEFSRRALALWDVFTPEWHYRLRLDDERRWQSVARMALGKAVNLVLSGGGCLGAIHCGILTALDETGFPIDTIGGTSAGAGIAISHALGNTPAMTAERFRYAFTEKKPFKAYTLPFYGLLNPRRLDNVLKEIANEALLEESLMPVHATVTNLTYSRAEVVTTGPAWEAIRMSGSLPGVLPPYIKNGCAYIDGGVMNNFPISAARQRYSGHYVGVTFNIPKDNLLESEYADLPNIPQTILAKLGLTQTSDFPGLGTVLTNSLVLSSTSGLKDAVNRVDLLLHPPVPPNVGITSFERFDQLYEIGVEYGREYLSRLESPIFPIN